MARKSLMNDIKLKILESPDNVFMPRDFFYMSDRDQVGRVFRRLIQSQILVKVGYGVYVKTRKSQYTGKIVPATDLRSVANPFPVSTRTFPLSENTLLTVAVIISPRLLS